MRPWRSWRMLLVMLPLLAVNAALPALPGGRELAGVSLGASLAVYGTHAVVFALAGVVMRATSPFSRAFLVTNRLESAVWILGSATLIGVSQSAASIYWVHLMLLVVLAFPMIASHRSLGVLFAGGALLATLLLALRAPLSHAVLAGLFGTAITLFHGIAMRVAPRSVWAQARAELLAEQASAVLLRAEQDRIRRELHDSLGAELTGLLWSVQSLEASHADQVDGLVHRIREGLAELRLVLHSVAPEDLPPARLADEMRRILARIERASTHIEVSLTVLHAAPDLVPGPTVLTVLRAVRECVTNALVHGHASRVDVEMRWGEVLTVDVHDDGDGVATSFAPGMGMRSIVDRLAEVGGRAEWLQRVPRGTHVRLTVPSH